jgi:hypothetical protein
MIDVPFLPQEFIFMIIFEIALVIVEIANEQEDGKNFTHERSKILLF